MKIVSLLLIVSCLEAEAARTMQGTWWVRGAATPWLGIQITNPSPYPQPVSIRITALNPTMSLMSADPNGSGGVVPTTSYECAPTVCTASMTLQAKSQTQTAGVFAGGIINVAGSGGLALVEITASENKGYIIASGIVSCQNNPGSNYQCDSVSFNAGRPF